MDDASTLLEVEKKSDATVIRDWKQVASHWDENGTVLVADSYGNDYLLRSPVHQIRNEGWCVVTLTYTQVSGNPVNLKIVDAESSAEIFHKLADFEQNCGTKLLAGNEFGLSRAPATGSLQGFKLPEPGLWLVDSPGAATGWDGTKQFVSWAGKRDLYLVKCYLSPCPTDFAVSLPISLEIKKGRLGIGILSEDQQNWVAQFEFDSDSRDEVLDIQTGDNHTLTVVLFSRSDAPLDATIDWKSNLVSSPREAEETADQNVREQVEEESATAAGSEEQILNAHPKLINESPYESPESTMAEDVPTESCTEQPTDAGIPLDSQGDAGRELEKSQNPGTSASLISCVARARVHASEANSVEFVIAQAEHNADEPLKISDIGVKIEEPEFLEDIPPVQAWTIMNGRWVDSGHSIEHSSTGSDHILRSPYFEILPGRRYIFALELDNDLRRNNAPKTEAALQFGLQDNVDGDWIESTKIQRGGRTRFIVSYVANTAMSVRLVLAPISLSAGGPSRLNNIQFEMNVLSQPEAFSSEDIDTYLGNWGFIRRGIHRLCKRSKSFNTFVSTLEMRMGREEVLSLPQYVGLCPTGQCNALCSFCSVTINRTGIIKRRLPYERIESFVAPVWNTARMFGLEGNGEPTLYPQFDDLYSMVTGHGASAYLITNGSRLKPQTIDLLQNRATDSINFSLNAATAETHREVMKLKNFEEILDKIRRLVRERGVDEVNPHVSASFVVENENVHEVVDFIDLAERDLKLDHIYVRPLSEIANDRGALEDHRDIVPYESDIQDMFDSVRDYLEDIPERTSILHFAPETFLAVRPDPAERIVMPKGYENALLAPRRHDWGEPAEGLDFRWFRNSLTLTTPNSTNEGPLLESVPIPVEIGRRMEFSCGIKVNSGALRVAVLTVDGREIVGETIEAGTDNTSRHYSWSVQSDDSDLLVISFQGCGTKLWAEIEFGRLRTPATGLLQDFKLPEPRRWMIDSPGTVTEWAGTKQFVSWAGKRGLYLVKSYSSPCLTDVALSLPISLEIRKGRLGIGILSEDQQNWVAQFKFDEGDRDEVLDIQTGGNRTLTFVLFSGSDAPLDATIDWKSNLVSSPKDTEEEAGQQIQEQVKEENTAATGTDARSLNATPKLITASRDEASEPTMPEPSPTEHRAEQTADAGISSDSQGDTARELEKSQVPGKLASLLRYIRFGKTKYYCQKPWTDLGNFSVDGRVDVCCIATGPSQERFMLGNLLFQNFQEVWNGRMAREFRRTVNGDKPLPPCARCPMAYAYQGPLFDREYTVNQVSSYLRWRTFLKRYVGKRGFGAVESGFIRPVSRIIGFLLFRGFKPIDEK